MLEAAESRNKLIQEQNATGIRIAELQEEKNEIALFSVQKDALSDEYFALKKMLAIEKLRKTAQKACVSITE